MDVKVTKDADLLICTAYKLYLQRRKLGKDKSSACIFGIDDISCELPDWSVSDIELTAAELAQSKLVKKYVRGFQIETPGIIYMENRFKNGLLEVIDVISKLKP